MEAVSYRTRRWRRFMSDHYWFVPSIDGVFIFAALLTVLVALAVLGTLLLGIWGHGPMAAWWASRPER